MGREIDKEMLICWKEISSTLRKLLIEVKIYNGKITIANSSMPKNFNGKEIVKEIEKEKPYKVVDLGSANLAENLNDGSVSKKREIKKEK